MKLNLKKTIYIGFAFLTIMMLWQVYNWFVPIYLNGFLENLFKGDKLIVGIIMALDNLFALFMIPLMSSLSDKTHTKIGRRMPYIIVGILLSAVVFIFLPITNSTGKIGILIVNILLVLICMNIYRSPCVALMPDVTPKPLRSKANSVINIMGGVGVAIGYLSIIVFSKSNSAVPFFIVAGVMIVCLIILLITVNENKFVKEYHEELAANGISESDDQSEDKVVGGASKTNKKNIYLILLVVFLVYMANNSVETFISLYSESVFANAAITIFGKVLEAGALVIIPFGIASFACAIPGALIADKIGRKNTVFIGAIFMGGAYLIMAILGFTTGFTYWLLLLFFIAGGGFSFITVNIYPMVIESCASDNVGKYTGHYYTASMLAQSVTPALCGLFMSGLVFANMRALFPYAAVFMALAAIVLLFVKQDKKHTA